MAEAEPWQVRELGRVLEEAKRWGVSVRVVKGYPIEATPGPRFCAIDPEQRAVYMTNLDYLFVQKDTLGRRILLHEISHVISEESPKDVCEYKSGMFGYEVTMARVLKLRGEGSWFRIFAASGRSLCRYPDVYIKLYIERGQELAREQGLLNANNRPTYRWSKERRKYAACPPGRWAESGT